MQQLAQMILLLSIIMHQYGVLVLLARLSDGQGLTILPFLSDCLYMLPFVFGHRTLQSGISSFCHEIWRKILKELVKLEIVSVWMNKDYLPNWPDCRHQVSYQVSWRCCRVRAGWGSGSDLKGVSTGSRMQTLLEWIISTPCVWVVCGWIAGVQIVNTL